MILENRGSNYGAIAGHIDGPVYIYNTIEAKKRLHSLMPKFIEILSSRVINGTPPDSGCIPSSYKIEDKIEHNRLLKYRSLVDDYGNYYSICENSFKALDNVVTFSKERILKSISEKYKSEKRMLLNSTIGQRTLEIELIRDHADCIIDKISDSIRNEIMLNYNEENIFLEDIDYCLPVFLCYAFVECKILERP